MPISWVSSDGRTGIAENAYEHSIQMNDMSNFRLTDQQRLEESFSAVGQGTPGQAPALGIPGQTPALGEPGQSPALGTPGQAPAEGTTGQAPPLGEPGQSSEQENYINSLLRNHSLVYRAGEAIYKHLKDKPDFDWSVFQGPSGEREDTLRAKQVEETFPIALGMVGAPASPGGVVLGSGIRGPNIVSPSNFKTALNKAGPAANTNTKPATINESIDSIEALIAKDKQLKIVSKEEGLTTQTIPQLQQAKAGGRSGTPPEPPAPRTTEDILPAVTTKTTWQEAMAKYEELSSQGKTTKQIAKASKLDIDTIGSYLNRDNLAIAAFNSENALTKAFENVMQSQLKGLDPHLTEALMKQSQMSVKNLKRFVRTLPEETLTKIFDQLPASTIESFNANLQRRAMIDAGKKSKIIDKPLVEKQTVQRERYNPSDLNQRLRLDKVLEEHPDLRQVPFRFDSDQIKKLTHQEYLDMMASEDKVKYLSKKGIEPRFE